MIRVALAGNANVGKSTLFNALTGLSQRVGNWPGVTVEKKTGRFSLANEICEVTDLPGISDFSDGKAATLDQDIAQRYLLGKQTDVVVCILDATVVHRGLYLATQLLSLDAPLVLALNMSDVAHRNGLKIDTQTLGERFGCEAVPVTASRNQGIRELKAAVLRAAHGESRLTTPASGTASLTSVRSAQERYQLVDTLLAGVLHSVKEGPQLTDWLDRVLLHPVLALPVFLLVMYLMFVVTIGFGGAFIDFFDGAATALFVEGPRVLWEWLGLPDFLVTLLADGVGGGVQLVATFIPIIGTLYLCLSFLEGSGYMARAAFLMDRLLRQIGLPGHAFVPLIVGFGCNVPAVMATRTLPGNSERILAALMAPYMSCGARLTVYALFAAAFFRGYAAEIVFLLYLTGILVAIFTVLMLRPRVALPATGGFVLEMPTYHLPRIGNICRIAWHRLRDFILRAGKAIVLVVIALNLLNSWGTDGSFGNENSETSVLSAIGKSIIPILEPMGVDEENWPAAVGLFTGIFAKEVVVGTLDALYSQPTTAETEDFELWQSLRDAGSSIAENLRGLGDSAADPLALGQVARSAEGTEFAEIHSTVERLQSSFAGDLAAFCYLMFILLYIPCVATVGVLYREFGGFWAAFSVAWSLVLAYSVSVSIYQIGTFPAHPLSSLIWVACMCLLSGAVWFAFVQYGTRRGIGKGELIPVREVN